MSDTPPSAGLIAGQLRYLFEERPRLAEGTAAELAEQLNHEDRFARARNAYPGEPDEVVVRAPRGVRTPHHRGPRRGGLAAGAPAWELSRRRCRKPVDGLRRQ